MSVSEKTRRRNSLFQFGFGIDAMKRKTVCRNCNSLENSKRSVCSECGEKLPKSNLYDFYKSSHKNCCECGTVLSDAMDYCPKCGNKVKNH